jgi:hypothetical protein
MMAQRRILILLVVAAVLASCASEPPQKPSPEQTEVQTTETAQTAQAETPENAQAATTAFVASQDLYKRTFTEVQEVIAALTRIIAKADYDGWLTYLTTDYITMTGSAANLDKASKSAILQKNGIVLKTLKDYFINVVVRSHHQVSLDDIQFVDATHVKAISMIQGTPVILYYLVHEEGRWKVGLQQAEAN